MTAPKGLIGLRKKYPNFRHDQPLNNSTIQWMTPSDNPHALGRLLKGTDYTFLVLENTDSRNRATFILPNTHECMVVADADQVNDKGLRTATGDYRLPPQTASLLSCLSSSAKLRSANQATDAISRKSRTRKRLVIKRRRTDQV